MPDEIKVDAEKFDQILGRMLNMLPLSKEEISAKLKTERERKAEKVKKYGEYRKAKKTGG